MRFETIAVQGGHDASKNRNCITVPVYQTSAYSFDSVEYAANLFDLKCEGDIYSRISNPTVQVLEDRLAMLEKGVGALCVSSGQSATLIAVTNIAGEGDEIISSPLIYGGTYNLFNVTLRKLGINTKFVTGETREDYEKLITEKTKCIFLEMLANPKLNIADVEEITKLAHEYNIPVIVDNTVPSPYLCNPIDFGADIVVHSLTKYIGGHGNSLGGVIVDSGKFEWDKTDKFECLTKPDESYHGVIYTKEFKEKAYITKARVTMLRDFGTSLSPLSAFLIIQGLETLAIRMERMSKTALEVAEYLIKKEEIDWVIYPGLKTDKYYNLAQKYMPKGASSIVAFGIKGEKERSVKFIEKVKLLIHATNIGDSRTILTYPMLTTHRQLSKEQLEEVGISENYMRLSVGLEAVEDIIEDIDQALR